MVTFEEDYLIKAGFVPNKTKTIWTKDNYTVTKAGDKWHVSDDGLTKLVSFEWMQVILEGVMRSVREALNSNATKKAKPFNGHKSK